MLVSLGFVAVLAAALAAALVVRQAQDHSHWVAHTYQVEREIATMARSAAALRADAVTAVWTGTPRSPTYARFRRDLFASIDTLAALTRDNALQQTRVPLLRRDYGELVRVLETPGDAGYRARLAGAEPVRLRLLGTIARMQAEEQRLLAIRIAAQEGSVRRFWIVLPLASLLLLAVAVASVLAIRRFTGDLARSKDELARMNEGLEDAVRERTRDLQRANDEIQRFAYIVSHDLRSPLVNVMGFTAELDASRKALDRFIEKADEAAPELVTQEARLAAREDLPEAIGFIRSSTQRMDRLINAILRLSREGRRTLNAEPLDSAAIVRASIDSMAHRIDELGADVAIEGALPAIACDRVAFEQIVANLIENAIKYLKPGTPGIVRIAGKAAPGRAIFTVTDNGRGIDPHDHERVFDLFRRSGAQDQPGEGIGLAHVRALAHRMGGTVDLRSELGKGATFIVDLPARFSGEGERAS